MKHLWFMTKWKFVACRRCGIIRNERNADKNNCRGWVKVGPRT